MPFPSSGGDHRGTPFCNEKEGWRYGGFRLGLKKEAQLLAPWKILGWERGKWGCRSVSSKKNAGIAHLDGDKVVPSGAREGG